MDRPENDLSYAQGFKRAESLIASLLGVPPLVFTRFLRVLASAQPAGQAVPLSAVAAMRGLGAHPGATSMATEADLADLDAVILGILGRVIPAEATPIGTTVH